MKLTKRFLFQLIISSFCFTALNAQNVLPATGGNASGASGSVSYSAGQIFYNTYSGTPGSVAQGLQQPYEISVVTSIGNTESITLEFKVYPNPTSGILKLIIKPFDNDNLKYQLYDPVGILIQEKKIESDESDISLENLSASIYFLKVIKDNLEVKVFKIIKK